MKKALSVVLALVMVLALFAACGGGGSGGTPTNDPGTSTPASDPGTNAPDSGSEPAGEPITLKVNNFAAEAYPFGQGLVAAKEYIEAESDGMIKIDLYHDGTLLSFGDTYQGVSQGIADIGIIGPMATDMVVNLNSVFTTMQKYIPGDPQDVVKACYDLLDAVPELQEEMEGVGVRWVGMYSLFGSSLHCKGIKPVVPDDLKGIGIEALGSVSGYFVLMGANGMTLDPGDYYLSLERGVISGQATHWPAMDGYKMVELTDYHLMFGEDGGGIFFGVMGYIMNLNSWNSLTPEQQTIIWDAFKIAGELSVELDRVSSQAAQDYANEKGQEFVYLSTEEELAPWYEYIDQYNAQWVERVSALGFPAQETLDSLQSILAKY